jgi:hypothetical protein
MWSPCSMEGQAIFFTRLQELVLSSAWVRRVTVVLSESHSLSMDVGDVSTSGTPTLSETGWQQLPFPFHTLSLRHEPLVPPPVTDAGAKASE